MKEWGTILEVVHGDKTYRFKANFFLNYTKREDMVRIDSRTGSMLLLNDCPHLVSKGVPGRRLTWKIPGQPLRDLSLQNKIIKAVDLKLNEHLYPLPGA